MHQKWCYLAKYGTYEGGEMPPCFGRPIRAHLIKQQVIRRELRLEKNDPILWDPRVWVWSCGGITGSQAHHGAFDVSRRLRLARTALPPAVEQFARDYQLEWLLEREYGALEIHADRGAPDAARAVADIGRVHGRRRKLRFIDAG